MATATDLLILADAFTAATKTSETAVSSRIFDDGKKLAAIRRGKDITLRRFNLAISWFAEHWPEDAAWPDKVPRPAPSLTLPRCAGEGGGEGAAVAAGSAVGNIGEARR
ncbi:hypothetical protein [Methylosinus sp. LW4]|uniref:hypothetical protein n=1 Tax=Methylosinus sp. LW4 TaxID=136993 RepID=UPI0003629832|nr:hypothetical protein [Methylosinus sp. LW4]